MTDISDRIAQALSRMRKKTGRENIAMSSSIPTTTSSGTEIPEPLRDLAKAVGPAVGLAAGTLTTVLGLLRKQSGGIFNRGLKTADVLLAIASGVLAAASGPLAANVVAEQGRKVVTPVDK